ncbi:hypothetical protein [Sphingobium yanoikuyae]|uniref:hypothetical protein n=1 Tax=Sphingobium yanoikuyae TaxID=13690 RepID=UPI00241F752F|nr:hypothetical protein [Sphingobium yanoikuyae]
MDRWNSGSTGSRSSRRLLFHPAGTVHAIGAGITLAEIQQNADVTYRLYDYVRSREQHLDDGVAVGCLTSYDRTPIEAPLGSDIRLLADSEAPSRSIWSTGTKIKASACPMASYYGSPRSPARVRSMAWPRKRATACYWKGLRLLPDGRVCFRSARHAALNGPALA